jgi:cytidyltransferase-like protein
VTTVFEDIVAWRETRLAQTRAGLTLGFVPTMGALHGGHRSLIRRSREENDLTVVSIFVNPTQFDDPADLARYPRALEDDLAVLRAEGTDFLLLPHAEALYADAYRYRVTETEASSELEGAHRPGHFDGVLTVVIGIILASAFSAILVYAQELIPGKVGLVAGLFFGLAFGMGGIASAVLGVVADHTSIEFVFLICSFLPLIGGLTYFLPDVRQR